MRDKLVLLPSEEVNGGIYVWVGADAGEAPHWRIPPVLEATGMKFAPIGGFRKWAEQFYPARGSPGPEAMETGCRD
ncbi:hypothetical protein [Streptomyces viridochromogenes]|nr:hypothetical protein [Streptomyces viridochromogenes]